MSYFELRKVADPRAAALRCDERPAGANTARKADPSTILAKLPAPPGRTKTVRAADREEMASRLNAALDGRYRIGAARYFDPRDVPIRFTVDGPAGAFLKQHHGGMYETQVEVFQSDRSISATIWCLDAAKRTCFAAAALNSLADDFHDLIGYFEIKPL